MYSVHVCRSTIDIGLISLLFVDSPFPALGLGVLFREGRYQRIRPSWNWLCEMIDTVIVRELKGHLQYAYRF